jgi:hypothetical protein
MLARWRVAGRLASATERTGTACVARLSSNKATPPPPPPGPQPPQFVVDAQRRTEEELRVLTSRTAAVPQVGAGSTDEEADPLVRVLAACCGVHAPRC